MKKLLLIAACMVATVAAFAQGQIVVANSAAVNGVRANVTDLATGALLTGATYWAQVYAGPSADSLTAQGSAVNFRTGANAGLISAQTIAVSTVGLGGNAFVQLKAWEGAAGSTYESSFGVAKTGFSNIVGPFVTGGAGSPPSTPPNVTGLNAFAIAIPEPSTIALALLGAGALFIRRRN